MPSHHPFIDKRFARFKTWWRTPASARDRFLGAFVGAFGGFWIGALALLFSGASPVSFGALGLAALAGASAGVVLGTAFPKGTTLFLWRWPRMP